MIFYSILLFIFLLCIFAFFWSKLRKEANQSPLNISTFEGNNSPYHPSVLFFPNKWNGYNYYMVETPFCNKYPLKGRKYRDQYECPSIHTSNDGIHWGEIANNPIDDLSPKNRLDLDFFSDPHLVFANGCLECWYRLSFRKGDYQNHRIVSLVRKKTTDGIHWTEREIMAELSDSHPLGNMVVSPAIIPTTDNYIMWYVDSIDNERHIAVSQSKDGKKWSDKTICTLNKRNINPWHIDVVKIENTYWLTIFDRNDLSIWSSLDGVNFEYNKTILQPSKIIGSFYSSSLYRACLLKDDKDYKLYFSAHDSLKTSIGIMTGDNPLNLTICSVDNKKYRNFFSTAYICIALFWVKSRGKAKRLLYRYCIKPLKNF